MAKNLKRAASLLLAILMVFSAGILVLSKEVHAASGNSITENPADLTVTEGEEAVFTVKANSQIKSVQWQVNRSSKWENLNAQQYGKSDTLRFTAGMEDNGMKIRAYVTFRNGSKKNSGTATLTVVEKAEETVASALAVRNTKAAAAPTRAGSSAPATEKTLIDNGDGTYTLALSVTGATESSTTTEVTKANVVLVVDVSNSMNQSSGSTTPYVYTEFTGNGTQNSEYWGTDADGDYMQVYWRRNADPHWRTTNNNNGPVYNGTVYTRSGGNSLTRLEAEKDALTKDGGIIDNLLSQNVPGDPNKSDIIEVGIVSFATRGNTVQSPTTNAATLKNAINGLTTSSGTNWQEGLQLAKAMADTFKTNQPNEDVYVIFLTDGEPTTHAGSYTVNTNYATEWGYASNDARSIVTAGYKFYGLFTWGSGNSSHYLSSLVQYAYTGTGNSNSTLEAAYEQYFTNASDTDTLINALNQIVHDITNSVGYTNVEMTDGVTTMTTSSVKTTASGEVTGLKYYRSGGSYSTTANNGLGEEWPVRSESNPEGAPAATINDNGEVDWNLGDLILENGVTYTVTFVVWPSQESMNIVADLNNGIISYDSLEDDVKSQIFVSGNHYTLKTNTDYPTVTYSTVTTTTVDGETTTVVSDPTTSTIVNPEPVGIADEMLNAKKQWEDSLDPSQREEIEDVVLYLLVDGHYYYVDAAGNPLGVTLTAESNWEETDYISIAPGILVKEDSPAYDPDAPHFTFEGVTYAMIERGHEYVFQESDINNHFELTAYVHHPMLMMGENGAEVKDVIFTKDAAGNLTGIESISAMGDNLSATNTLKGGINIQKKVVDSEGNEVDTDDTFKVTVTLTDADGNALPTKNALVDGETVNYTIDYRVYYGEKNPHYNDNDKHRSDHIYVTGTSFQETLYIGDVIRVVNVENDAVFTVTEETFPLNSAYVLDKVTYQIKYGDATAFSDYDDTNTVKDASGNVIGYLVKGNSASDVVVVNKLKNVFYVYHSSDNTIECIDMEDSRVNNGKFDITKETKAGYLYGGYFKVYGKAGMTDAEIRAAAFTEKADTSTYTYGKTAPAGNTLWLTDTKDGAAPYTGAAVSFKGANAYTESGLSMTPKAGTVYYLKEVPNAFFRPATYVIWDTRSENLDLKKLYMLSVTDDSVYQKVGLDGTIGLGTTTKLYSTFKVTNDTGATVSVKVKDVNSTLPRGFLTVWDANSKIVAGEYTITPFFVTKDNVKVTSAVTRTLTLSDKLSYTATDFVSSDAEVSSTCSAYSE